MNTAATDERLRLRFIQTLNELNDDERARLLSLETEVELRTLFALALASGFTSVAASIEVAAAQ